MTVSEVERSIVSGVERLRFGGSSGGNTAGLELVETAGQPSDDGCYENGKLGFWSMGDLAMPRGLPEDLYSPPPACGLSILLVYIHAAV